MSEDSKDSIDERGVDERSLDRLLAQTERVEPSAQLVRRVAEIPLRHPRDERARGWSFWWRPVLSIVACAAAGVMIGWLSPEDIMDDELGASVAAYDQTDDEEISVAELALSDQLLEGWQ